MSDTDHAPPLQNHLSFTVVVVTAHKRKVWSKVMLLHLSVSHSVHGEVGGFCMMSISVWLSHIPSGLGVSVEGGVLCPFQGVSVWGVSVWGVSIQGSLCRDTPRNQKSWRYASYWNAFLFTK